MACLAVTACQDLKINYCSVCREVTYSELTLVYEFWSNQNNRRTHACSLKTIVKISLYLLLLNRPASLKAILELIYTGLNL